MTLVSPPADSLDSLGVRARVRRMGLPMRSVHLATALGVSRAMLQQWELRMPSTLESSLQGRWEQLLRVPPGWLTDPSMVAGDEAEPLPVYLSEDRHPTIADAIRGVGQVLAQYQGERRDMEHKDYPEIMQRNVELFATRYGVNGEGRASFKAAGVSQGITMQRAQQVVNKMLLRSTRYCFALPALDRLESRLTELLPAPVEIVDDQLGHLLGGRLSIRGVQRFSVEILHRSLVSFDNAA